MPKRPPPPSPQDPDREPEAESAAEVEEALAFFRSLPAEHKRRLLILRVMKADAEQVEEVLTWGADANSRTKKGMPAIIRLVRNHTVMADVVEVLLRYGADPNIADSAGLTALDYARRRLLKFEGKPRTGPRRSPSLTPGGELRLPEWEWKEIEQMEAEHPGYSDEYLQSRRRVAEHASRFDNRGQLERVVEILEPLAGRR